MKKFKITLELEAPDNTTESDVEEAINCALSETSCYEWDWRVKITITVDK